MSNSEFEMDVKLASNGDGNVPTPFGLETEARFVIEGESIKPGGTLSMRISVATYDAFRAGAFVAYGTCGEIKYWQKKGTSLAVQAVENTSQWKVTVSITDCSG